ncbi:lytic murein transglycosylase [Blastochloris viridis]|uniref:Membrane-bound lytic murein transglycosylase B n=1 Tax=Blastochloris viridis TaxID=1079 RepID=A0A0H5BC08_BLAVI|nr:lytic murein transglycosylase [Blastochloris viridis]ALK10339.1 Membrane-bound lytic murein transglycosylase B precursor [Blastochloris viridis]BAR99725.1 membrane-bound lytic murein transglycosylase B precursor [Blastochloris viridis]CUU43001.1 Membrane-bound lytic murein transglycosylase B precursor [Blastochloris viridis]
MPSCARLATLAVAALWSATAYAQDITSSIPAQPRASHPLMTPEALAEAEANFSNCLAGLWPAAQRRGINRQTFEAVVRATTPDMSLFKLMDGQPEFERPIWWYVDSLVTETRIRKGREMLAQYKPVFDAIERQWGVDRHLLTAIWGIESNFGTRDGMGGRDVVRSTASLACIGRRQAYFQDEFLAAVLILQRGDVPPDHMRGSWAGAFGMTQFMPTGYVRYAVDFDGDGHANLVDSVPDALASTANRFRAEKWMTGQTWGYEVVLPPGFDYLLADRNRRLSLGEWSRLGAQRANGLPFPRSGDQAFLLIPAGSRGPAFLMLENFRVIMRYNPAEAYALAIGHLADRMRGGGPFVQAWPRDAQLLSRNERFELQMLLLGYGFDIGQPDGKIGGKTRTALRQVQAQLGLVPDGFATTEVLSHLKR